jgi:predicted NAD/FAD-dependent oxidoreductase
MATRTVKTALGDVRFDIGAQYFTAQTPRFSNQVAQWVEDGVVTSWPEAGPHAWVGSPSMSSPLGAMAAAQNVNWNSFVGGISRKNDGWRLHLDQTEEGPFDVVVIALPAEQATPLLALNESMFMLQSASSVSTPCWCGMFAFAEPLNSRSSIFRETGAVSWACRNTAKPGRHGPEAWVVQADPLWSRTNLEVEPEIVAKILLSKLLAMTETPLAVLQVTGPRPGRALEFHDRFGRLWRLAPRPKSRRGMALGFRFGTKNPPRACAQQVALTPGNRGSQFPCLSVH